MSENAVSYDYLQSCNGRNGPERIVRDGNGFIELVGPHGFRKINYITFPGQHRRIKLRKYKPSGVCAWCGHNQEKGYKYCRTCGAPE